jgi:alcohol dehydrogenase class IV
METNLRALRERQPGNPVLGRFEEVARMLTGAPAATPEQGIGWLHSLVTDLKIPHLRVYGITRAHTNELVEKAAKASSMKANPIALTADELTVTLERAL